MPESEVEIEITITISRKAFEKATRLIAEDHGAGGEFVRLMTTEDFIAWLVEGMLDDYARRLTARSL